MNSMKSTAQRAMRAMAFAGLCGIPLLLSACEKTESKTTEESKKVVDTPEGKKTVTESTETKTTTQGK